MTLFETRNDLKSNTKITVVALLNRLLADGIDLALLTKQAHWNMKGPQFVAIHEMVDDFHAEIDTNVDTLAERIVQLGGTAFGTTQAVNKTTSLKPYPTDVYKCKDHLAELIERYGKAANAVRAGIDESDNAGDANTADILTGYSRALDKALWFLEAHTQEPS